MLSHAIIRALAGSKGLVLDRILAILPVLAILAIGGSGCGGRTMGTTNNSTDDGGAGNDGGANNNNNNNPGDPCEAMDAVELEVGAVCLDERPLGWSWDGAACVEIWCYCGGEECGNLYQSLGGCLAARAPSCLPANSCLDEPYDRCQQRPDCRIEYYGGGCFNLDDCSPDAPGEDNWICWEQGIVCVPADHPCTLRGPGDCDGECYWWGRSQELCFEQCCTSESYGYCAPVPGAGAECEAQNISFCADPCADTVGWRWDGGFCRPVQCCCEGPDCGAMYATREACVTSRQGCLDNTCAIEGGYCDYGDYTPGACQDGYYVDEELTQQEPGVCGMGSCCAPCLEPVGTDFGYIGHSPQECADIDWDCFSPDFLPFENACGCGCYRPLNGGG